MRSGIVYVLAFFWIARAFGQTVTGAGYSAPVAIRVAPGQVITLYVQGLSSLEGIGVTVRQDSDYPAPVLQVAAVPGCAGMAPATCGSSTAITVQIPYEIIPQCVASPVCTAIATVPAYVIVSQNGVSGNPIGITPLADQIHILTACDSILSTGSEKPLQAWPPCQPMVTHADGSLVTNSSPARPGEELVLYAVGLGATNPAAKDGQPPAGPIPVAGAVQLDFNFHANSLASKPPISPIPPQPVFAGLTPGYPGLYQVNFVLPQAPPDLPPCLLIPGAAVPSTWVPTNVTVSISAAVSFDGAPICVRPAP